MTMKRPYQITAVVIMLFAAYIVWTSLNLRYYTSLGPGPGFFPFWISSIIGVLGAIMFIQATRSTEPMPADFFASKVGYLRMLAITVGLVAVVVLTETVGFRLMMLVFLLFMFFALGRVNPVTAVVVAAATSFGLYYMIVQLLRIPLPIGMFGI
jgi:putative tricarboxylic transport membrane protein